MSVITNAKPCRQNTAKMPVSSNIPHMRFVISSIMFFQRDAHGLKSGSCNSISVKHEDQSMYKTYPFTCLCNQFPRPLVHFFTGNVHVARHMPSIGCLTARPRCTWVSISCRGPSYDSFERIVAVHCPKKIKKETRLPFEFVHTCGARMSKPPVSSISGQGFLDQVIGGAKDRQI